MTERQAHDLEPGSYGEAMELARLLCRGTLVPVAFRSNGTTDLEKKAASLFAVIITGRELGIGAMRAIKALPVESGQITMEADLQLALCRRDGNVAYHDEGFEKRGVTDVTLKGRTRDADRVLAMVATLDVGKIYGWCSMQRQGSDDLITRVFTEDDAAQVEIVTWVDDEQEEGKRKRQVTTLDKKDNYRNYPQDIYPKRARTRVIGVGFSDSTNGIPARESLQGAPIFDAPAPVDDDQRRPDAPDVEDLMVAMTVIAPTVADKIAGLFERLALPRARRLALLLEYRATPLALADWLALEEARRAGPATAAPDTPSVPAVRPRGSKPPARKAKRKSTKEPKAKRRQRRDTSAATVSEPPAVVEPATAAPAGTGADPTRSF